MAYEFRLPDLGEGVHEGEIVRWRVAEGQFVAEDEPLVEVMTDKVTAEIPSPVAGRVVRLLAREGEVVKVGTPLVEIDGEAPAESPPPAQAAPAAPRAEPEGGRAPLAVPAVRKLARDLGVDLAEVTPSGPGGRITLSDVRAYAERRARGEGEPIVPPPPREPHGEERIPLRGLRRRIAEHLQRAHREAVPCTFVEEADFTELVRLREQVRPTAEQRGIELTYLPFIIAATCTALKEHPRLNATVDPDSGDLVLHRDYHIAIAVQTSEGLMVPVIRDADQRRLLDLAREIRRLGDAARAGKLTREEATGGTFSITSLGKHGGLLGTPVLNFPQVAILSVHRIAERPVVRDGRIVIRQIGHLALTFDHRYLDGAEVAAFVATLLRYLEDPALLLFSLAEFPR